MELYLQQADPRDCPLFIELVGAMLRDSDEEHRTSEPDMFDEVWQSLSEVYNKHMQSVPTARWFGELNSAEDFNKTWTRRVLTICVLMIALDMGKTHNHMR